MRDLANLSLGVGIDILRGNVGSRDGSAVVGAIRETRRSVEVGQKIGQHKEVLDAPGGQEEPSREDVLRAEEEALTARLEQIRETRAASAAREG